MVPVSDGTALDGEVFGDHNDRAPVEAGDTTDESICRYGGAASRVSRSHQSTDLGEGSPITEARDPFSDVETPLSALTGEPLLSSHGLPGTFTRFELC
jgi:hypothetical protein